MGPIPVGVLSCLPHLRMKRGDWGRVPEKNEQIDQRLPSVVLQEKIRAVERLVIF